MSGSEVEPPLYMILTGYVDLYTFWVYYLFFLYYFILLLSTKLESNNIQFNSKIQVHDCCLIFFQCTGCKQSILEVDCLLAP